jgi:hypothetical protein
MPNMLNGVAGSSHSCNRSAALRPIARNWQAAREILAGLMLKDRVDLPETAGEYNCSDAAPGVDHDLVERIRRSIAARDYLTPEKIDVTVDCIYRELFGR